MTAAAALGRRPMAWALRFAALMALAGACKEQPALPELVEVPAFELIDHRGEPFDRGGLEGKVSIISFVFTRCPTICPLLSQHSMELQEEIRDEEGIQIVSISVDPDHDTPAELRAYRERFSADDALWVHLTGQAPAIHRVAVQGFRVALGEREPVEGGGYDILHSSHFILVDRSGTIRGYYRAEPEPLRDLLRDAKRLVAE
ncbi:MAG: SCO family protein [Myxococcota bacterium]